MYTDVTSLVQSPSAFPKPSLSSGLSPKSLKRNEGVAYWDSPGSALIQQG